jgi:hypothetical protein
VAFVLGAALISMLLPRSPARLPRPSHLSTAS